MPWEERKALELRKEFVHEATQNEEALAELCRKYAISRVTGYKWLKRFAASGEDGLQAHSRTPKHCPQAMPDWQAKRIVELRRKHPRWGPRKLRDYLVARDPE